MSSELSKRRINRRSFFTAASVGLVASTAASAAPISDKQKALNVALATPMRGIDVIKEPSMADVKKFLLEIVAWDNTEVGDGVLSIRMNLIRGYIRGAHFSMCMFRSVEDSGGLKEYGWVPVPGYRTIDNSPAQRLFSCLCHMLNVAYDNKTAKLLNFYSEDMFRSDLALIISGSMPEGYLQVFRINGWQISDYFHSELMLEAIDWMRRNYSPSEEVEKFVQRTV